MPSVHVRQNPSGALTVLIRERTSHDDASSSSRRCVSGVHLLCIKVSGKDVMGVSRLACSSLKGYRQMRARGGADTADDCIFYRGGGGEVCGCTAGWRNTPGSQSKPAQKHKRRQSTPVPVDAANSSNGLRLVSSREVFSCCLASLPPVLPR